MTTAWRPSSLLSFTLATSLPLTLVALGVLAPSTASAQDGCFTVTGEPGARPQTLVGLDQTVRIATGCELGLTADGSFIAPGPLAAREVDFLEIYRHLASTPGAAAAGDPRVVFARRARGRAADAPQQTLMLRYCAHYLLEEQLGFRVVPEVGGGSFRVERVPGASCDAARLELRAVQGARAERLYTGPAEQTLGASQPSLELPQGDWSIFAARPGGTVALRVGVFRSQRVVTPLQNHLRSVGIAPRDARPAPPLLAARWDPGGPGLLLQPTEYARQTELLWPELATAADAGFLWIARPTADGPPVVMGLVQLEAGEPASVRLPDSVVRDFMRTGYGEAGDALAPSTDDWRAIFSDLALCLTPNYQDGRTAAIGAAVPDAGACASLLPMSVFAQAAEAQATAAGGDARVCLRSGMQVLTATGPEQALGEPECFAIPRPGSTDAAPLRMAVAGDRLTLEGSGMCVLIDGVASTPEEGGEHVLRSGLLEVRQGGGADCTSRQAISRLRLPVVDPSREWHPVGFYTGSDEAALACEDDEDAVCPWQSLAHDEHDVFAFVEPRHELDFLLTTSPQVAAALNGDPTRPAQLTQDVPVLTGVRGRFEGPPEPAVVAYVTRDADCPSEVPYVELRERPPVDVDALLVDATFHVFLLSVEAPDAPARCLARASFRTRSSRALVAATVADFLGMEVGLLGDTQAVFFANDPIALGVALPLVWFRMTPGIRFLSLEIAGNLVMSAAFDPAELSRVGVSLSWALSLGIPEYLPRIVSVGGMLHGAAETSTIDNPIVSFFVGLNLATLLDLAGGR